MFSIIKFALISTLVASYISPSLACEGECIVGITKAFVSNYDGPVLRVLGSLSDAINHQFFHGNARDDAVRLVASLYSFYNEGAYNRSEYNIFPSYFHGKCQDKNHGIEPEGCPNPDCPVVCGTPGSLVHFYSKLASIAYNTTASGLAQTAFLTTGTTYTSIESAIVRKALGTNSRRAGVSYRSRRLHKKASTHPFKDEASIKSELKNLLHEYAKGLELSKQCGGQGIPDCLWKKKMVPFILSFP